MATSADQHTSFSFRCPRRLLAGVGRARPAPVLIETNENHNRQVHCRRADLSKQAGLLTAFVGRRFGLALANVPRSASFHERVDVVQRRLLRQITAGAQQEIRVRLHGFEQGVDFTANLLGRAPQDRPGGVDIADDDHVLARTSGRFGQIDAHVGRVETDAAHARLGHDFRQVHGVATDVIDGVDAAVTAAAGDMAYILGGESLEVFGSEHDGGRFEDADQFRPGGDELAGILLYLGGGKLAESLEQCRFGDGSQGGVVGAHDEGGQRVRPCHVSALDDVFGQAQAHELHGFDVADESAVEGDMDIGKPIEHVGVELGLGDGGGVIFREDGVAADGVGLDGEVHEGQCQVGFEGGGQGFDGFVVFAVVLLGQFDGGAGHFDAGKAHQGGDEASALFVGFPRSLGV